MIIRDVFNDNDIFEQLDHLLHSCTDHFIAHGISERWITEETLLQIQMDPDRHIFGTFITNKKEMIGAMELKIGYPAINTLTIGWILIDPEYRGKGMGSKLLNYIEKWARKEWNVNNIFIYLSETEILTKTFFLKNGFINLKKQQIEKQEGKEFTVTLFGKCLDQEPSN